MAGRIYAEIELINGGDLALLRHGYALPADIRRLRVNACVDSGAYMLAFNETVKAELDLLVVEERIVKRADESEITVKIVGPVEIRFENRSTTMNAMILPDIEEIWLGSIPLSDLDVVIDPQTAKTHRQPRAPVHRTEISEIRREIQKKCLWLTMTKLVMMDSPPIPRLYLLCQLVICTTKIGEIILNSLGNCAAT
jgi:clan AA aspartic protease